MSDGSIAILVTGAAGKVGQCLIESYLAEQPVGTIRALCHNRIIEASDRIEVVRGTISDRDVVRRAMDGVTHVVHLATCKETPEQVMDVTVKGKAATLKLGIRATVRIRGQAGAMHWGVWTIDWIRSANGWRITRIIPDMIDGQPIGSLRTLEAYVH